MSLYFPLRHTPPPDFATQGHRGAEYEVEVFYTDPFKNLGGENFFRNLARVMFYIARSYSL